MKLDITEIMNRRKDRLDFSFDFKFPDSPDGALLPAGVTLAGPAQIDCRVTDVNGFIKADFTVHAPLRNSNSRSIFHLRDSRSSTEATISTAMPTRFSR